MATDSSVLAWRIPGTVEPGGMPSMGSHRVGHDWSELAAPAADLNFTSMGWDQANTPYSAQIALNTRRLGGGWPHGLEEGEQWGTSFYGLGNIVLTDSPVKIGLFEAFKQGGFSLLHRMRWIWPWSCAPWRHCLQRLPCLPQCYDGEKVTH